MSERMSDILNVEMVPFLLDRGRTWMGINQREDFKKIYAQLLIETYHYVKHSCLLMDLAQSLMTEERFLPLRDYLRGHIGEEQGHELWLLQDLKHLGLSADEVRDTFPCDPVVSMVGGQYFLIRELSAASIMGYIYVLEAQPPNSEHLRQLAARYSIPLEAMSTLLEHSDIDVSHAHALKETLDSATFSDRERALLVRSATSTASQLCGLFRTVASQPVSPA